ncbi:MAG: hypothetical protein ACE5ID_02355, partial [Acidobacteriota bacterium]
MKPPSRVDLAVTLGLLMGPAGASPLPAATEPHTPPARNQVLDDQARERPLMTALRLTGESLGEARWSRRTTQEMGSSALGDMF